MTVNLFGKLLYKWKDNGDKYISQSFRSHGYSVDSILFKFMQYGFSLFSISIMQKYNLLKMLNVTDNFLWVRDIVNTV